MAMWSSLSFSEMWLQAAHLRKGQAACQRAKALFQRHMSGGKHCLSQAAPPLGGATGGTSPMPESPHGGTRLQFPGSALFMQQSSASAGCARGATLQKWDAVQQLVTGLQPCLTQAALPEPNVINIEFQPMATSKP